MDCSQIKQRLSEPIGFHSPDVEAHIHACPSCRRVWEAERLLRDGLAAARTDRGLASSLGTASTWVKAVVTHERTHPMKSLVRHPFISVRRRWGFSLAVVAAVLAFLVLVPFSYEHTVGTRLAITSADPAMAQVDIKALNERLAARGLADVTIAWSNEAAGRALTYYVHGSSTEAMAAFAATRDMIPAAAADGHVAIEPWRVRESGSLLAQIGARVFEVHVSAEGKSDAEVEAGIRAQLAAQGMQLQSISYSRDANGQSTVKLEGVADVPGGQAQVKIEDVRLGGQPNDSISTQIMLSAPDSTLSDEAKIAEIKRQLAAQGITDAEVAIKDGKVEVRATKTKP